MRIMILVLSLMVGMSLGNVPFETAQPVIACDVINHDGKQLLFTVEGANDTVYSPHLKMHLKTGSVIKIYQIDAVDNFIEDTSVVDRARINQLDLTCIYQNEMRSAHPWLITVGQSDDDAHIEVFVGAFRATKYFSAETRPYFLEYRNGVIVRRWTGSRLNCVAFSDAEYVDYDGDGRDELKVVEHDFRNGKPYCQVGYYRLYGFIPQRLIFNR